MAESRLMPYYQQPTLIEKDPARLKKLKGYGALQGTRDIGKLVGRNIMETPGRLEKQFEIFNPPMPGDRTIEFGGQPMRIPDDIQTTRLVPVPQIPGQMVEVERDPGEVEEEVFGRLLDASMTGDVGALGMVKAFHGSPHRFSKFDMSKMGSGEGAQAFGWGMYFTGEKNIAQHYAKSGESAVLINGKSLAQRKRFQKLPEESKANVELLLRDMSDGTMSKDELFGYAAQMRGDYLTAYNFIRDAKSVKYAKPNLYETTLHPTKAKEDWLDWYEPIPDKYKKKIDTQFEKEFGDKILWDVDMSGEQIYRGLTQNIVDAQNKKAGYKVGGLFRPSDKEASLFLNRAGIDGIRYPTGTLSGKAKTARDEFNYVVFDPDAIRIDKVE